MFSVILFSFCSFVCVCIELLSEWQLQILVYSQHLTAFHFLYVCMMDMFGNGKQKTCIRGSTSYHNAKLNRSCQNSPNIMPPGAVFMPVTKHQSVCSAGENKSTCITFYNLSTYTFFKCAYFLNSIHTTQIFILQTRDRISSGPTLSLLECYLGTLSS